MTGDLLTAFIFKYPIALFASSILLINDLSKTFCFIKRYTSHLLLCTREKYCADILILS